LRLQQRARDRPYKSSRLLDPIAASRRRLRGNVNAEEHITSFDGPDRELSRVSSTCRMRYARVRQRGSEGDSQLRGRAPRLMSGEVRDPALQRTSPWVTKLYLPLYWSRYQVSSCRSQYISNRRPHLSYTCKYPQGSFVRTRNGGFDAVLVASSRCWREVRPGVTIYECRWDSPAGATYTRVTAPVPADCRYDPTPGSTAAWRYGCPYGVPPSELIDGKNGWTFPITFCSGNTASCSTAPPPPGVAVMPAGMVPGRR
jgi:hypothetical protein